MTRFVATLRAAFEAGTNGEAEAVSQNVLMAVEGVLGEDDDPADEPSYKVNMTEVLPFATASTYPELADRCLQLRNQLIGTKTKPCLHVAGVLDELAWQIRRVVNPDVDDLQQPYDRARLGSLCVAIWERGENPTD